MKKGKLIDINKNQEENPIQFGKKYDWKAYWVDSAMKAPIFSLEW